LIVEIAMPIWGTLRVNPLFKEALREAPRKKQKLEKRYRPGSLAGKMFAAAQPHHCALDGTLDGTPEEIHSTGQRSSTADHKSFYIENIIGP
jgi:hypothetical protein